MNLLRRIFQRDTTPAAAGDTTLSAAPPEDLFLDRTPPVKVPDREDDSLIGHFLARDYQLLGQEEGFDYHSADYLKAARRRIRAEFLVLLDKVQLENREQGRQIKNRMVELEDIAPDMYRQLELRLEETQRVLDVLDHQKVLAANEEGWLMQALNAYQVGYLRGVQDRLDSDDFLDRQRLL